MGVIASRTKGGKGSGVNGIWFAAHDPAGLNSAQKYL